MLPTQWPKAYPATAPMAAVKMFCWSHAGTRDGGLGGGGVAPMGGINSVSVAMAPYTFARWAP